MSESRDLMYRMLAITSTTLERLKAEQDAEWQGRHGGKKGRSTRDKRVAKTIRGLEAQLGNVFYTCVKYVAHIERVLPARLSTPPRLRC